MKDKTPDKRARLIERMVSANECAEFFADVWLDAWFSAPTRERLRHMVDSLRKN